jgi:hypothetical protein
MEQLLQTLPWTKTQRQFNQFPTMKYLLIFLLISSQALAQKVGSGDLKIIPTGDYAIEVSKVAQKQIIEHYWAHLQADLTLQEHNTVHCYIEYQENTSDFEHAYLKFQGHKAFFQGYEWLVEYQPQYDTWVLTRCTVFPSVCWCIVITKMPSQ